MAGRAKKQQVAQIALSEIRAGANDRQVFEENALRELAQSIQEHGLAQPITVRPVEQGYEIVAGERRFRAVSLLGWETIPALVRELSDEQAAAIMLAENTSRVDLDPVTEAKAYQVRQERFGWDVAKIAQAAGVSVQRVRSRVELLVLAEDILHFVARGALPIGHAQAMIGLDVNRQRIALRVYNKKPLPLAAFGEVVAELRRHQAEENQMSLFALESFLVAQHAGPEALRGRAAKTGVTVREDLPAPRISGKDSSAEVVMRWIVDLESNGFQNEAAVVGTIYDALVKANYMKVVAR